MLARDVSRLSLNPDPCAETVCPTAKMFAAAFSYIIPLLMGMRWALDDLPAALRAQALAKLAQLPSRTVLGGRISIEKEIQQEEDRAKRVKPMDWTKRLLFSVELAGLPKPECEHRFHPTRKWRFDLAWVDMRLAVEIEGITHKGGRHQRIKGFSEDCRKYAEAVILNWRVVRVTPRMIRDGEAISLIERAYKRCAASHAVQSGEDVKTVELRSGVNAGKIGRALVLRVRELST